jgi:integrin alpha FG-GAP repeat containing protein 1
MMVEGEKTIELKILFNHNIALTDAFSLTGYMIGEESQFGRGMLGINFKCRITNLEEVKSTRLAVQNAQNGFAALSSRIAYFGIGRSNNYIEDFTATRPFKDTNVNIKQRVWSPIIPMSKLIVTANTENERLWTIQLVLSPSIVQFAEIGFSLVTLLTVLGILIIYFHCKEKKEDKLENEKNFKFLA